jgi:hypothetical protein
MINEDGLLVLAPLCEGVGHATSQLPGRASRTTKCHRFLQDSAVAKILSWIPNDVGALRRLPALTHSRWPRAE